MYLCNKYTSYYYSIIRRAQARLPNKEYMERHHIIPKSLGGTNERSNIAILTPKEHFVCHRLLTRMTTGNARSKMCFAAWAMATLKNGPLGERYKINSKTYSSIRSNLPKILKSEETKQKMRKPKPEGFGKKVSEYRTGKSWGYHPTDQTKEKMSAWQKNIPKPKIKCEHCNKEFILPNYKMWHGNNCKNSPNYVKPSPLKTNQLRKICEYCNEDFQIGLYTRWHGGKCKSNIAN